MPKPKYSQSFKPLRRSGRFYKIPSLAYNIPMLGAFIMLIGLSVMGMGEYGKTLKVNATEAITVSSTHAFTWVCTTVEGKETCEGTKPVIVEPVSVVPKAVVAKPKAKASKSYSDSQMLVAAKVASIAKEHNFKDVPYLLALADCESSFNPKTINIRGNKPSTSKDRGIFQYNSFWQKKVSDKCAFDITCATKLTIENLNAGRHSLWACNKVIKNEKRLPQYVTLVSKLP